jgi:hypothetical protein
MRITLPAFDTTRMGQRLPQLTTQDVQVTVSPSVAACATARATDITGVPVAASAVTAADCWRNSRRGIKRPPVRLDMGTSVEKEKSKPIF